MKRPEPGATAEEKMTVPEDAANLLLPGETLNEALERSTKKLRLMEQQMAELRRRHSEREKELACHILLSNLLDEITRSSRNTCRTLKEVAENLPPAMQFPDICAAKIVFPTALFTTKGWREDSPWRITRPLRCRYPTERIVGSIDVCYYEDPTERIRTLQRLEGDDEDGADAGRPFLQEEEDLLQVVAERVSNFISRGIAENRVAELTGPLQFCYGCNSVRDEERWKPLRQFLEERASIEFTSTLCMKCAAAYIEESQRQQQEKSREREAQAAKNATKTTGVPKTKEEEKVSETCGCSMKKVGS